MDCITCDVMRGEKRKAIKNGLWCEFHDKKVMDMCKKAFLKAYRELCDPSIKINSLKRNYNPSGGN